MMGMCEYGAWLIQHENYSEVTIMQSLTSILYEASLSAHPEIRTL
jgi:hypothetical protein